MILFLEGYRDALLWVRTLNSGRLNQLKLKSLPRSASKACNIFPNLICIKSLIY